jgi:transposase
MITVAPLEPGPLADLRRHYEEAATPETRTRYHMVLLAKPGQRVPQIARLVERSEDIVARVLKRFLTQGLEAVPRRRPGALVRGRTVTAAWESELLRVIELDPHEVGQETANWTTQRLASYLAEQTGIKVSLETVRTSLHTRDYVCKRPTWTLKRKAEAQANYVGNACG